MEDLYQRLPRLLNNRTEWSTDKAKAFPTSIRLTVRLVDPERKGDNRRRPFSTKSKQTSFDGKLLLSNAESAETQTTVLRKSIRPLLESLVSGSTSNNIDITRINVALTGFQDVVATGSPKDATKSSLDHSNQPLQSSSQSKAAISNLKPQSTAPRKVQSFKSNVRISDDIDAEVLSALPPDIAAEVRSGLHSSKHQRPAPKRTRIDQFFSSKK